MKKILLLFVTSTLAMAQQTVDLSMESGYANEVYFKFSDESNSSYDRENWDVAFLRTSNYNQAIRANEGKGLNVYEASSNVDDWDTLDISAAEGTALHNSSTVWESGAFNQGSATYGWGEYNMVNHHVTGSVIFLIENYASSTYYKFMIEDYFGAYTIKYALWDAGTSTWGADQTATISNTTNDGYLFNFFNLETGEEVEASPALADWDIVFKRYSTMVSTNTGDTQPYTVTGTLQNPNVTVAQVDEAIDADPASEDNLSFESDIDIIGYDWKQLNASWAYEIVENRVYYVKSDDKIYRMYFTSFEGSSTGNLSFVYKEVTLATIDIDGKEVQFGIYPNPVKDDKITIVYDNEENLNQNAEVEIYNMLGQKVYSTQLSDSQGFRQREVELGNLPSGNYILRFVYGKTVESKKIIVK